MPHARRRRVPAGGCPVIEGLAVPGWACLVVAPIAGSFAGVLASRLPVGEPLILARSRCPACRRPIAPLDLVPLVGWLARRGRCRACDAAIPLFYPGVELAAVGIAAWALATVPDGWLLWATCALGWTLLALALADLCHFVLPDALTLPLIAGGLAVATGLDGARPLDHVLGAVAGFAVLWAVAAVYRRLRRREGLGLGDAKLLAAAGAWVSWTGLASVMLWAGGTALAVVAVRGLLGNRLRRDEAIPFGPYLALGAWLVWLWGPVQLG